MTLLLQASLLLRSSIWAKLDYQILADVRSKRREQLVIVTVVTVEISFSNWCQNSCSAKTAEFSENDPLPLFGNVPKIPPHLTHLLVKLPHWSPFWASCLPPYQETRLLMCSGMTRRGWGTRVAFLGGKTSCTTCGEWWDALINLVATVCVCDWDSPRCKQMGTTVLWGTCGTKFNTSSFLWNIDIVPMAEVETWPSPSRGSVEQAKDMGAAASSSETGTLIGSAGLQDI